MTATSRADTSAADTSAADTEQGIQLELSAAQQKARREFRAFTAEHITPFAGQWDREARIPNALVDQLRGAGYLGSIVSTEAGGGGMDPVTYGLLTEEIAVGCSSVRSLLTVHDMVALTANRWGNPQLREEFGGRLAKAELLGALALSEPNIGSNAAGVQTRAREVDDGWVIDGTKRWTTYGMLADVYLLFARVDDGGDGKVTAFLVPADTPGIDRQAITGMVGTRASMIAHIEFKDVKIPKHHMLARVGFGFSHVCNFALDHGRYSVAWGSVGIAQACLDACLDYTASRQQFDVPINEHQLVRRKLTNMIANTRAARLLCYRAGYQRRVGDPSAAMETMLAKYFASKTAVEAANDAVQLHGANGLYDEYPIERYLRDAKVTEIIEGSSQIQQITLPRFPLPEL